MYIRLLMINHVLAPIDIVLRYYNGHAKVFGQRIFARVNERKRNNINAFRPTIYNTIYVFFDINSSVLQHCSEQVFNLYYIERRNPVQSATVKKLRIKKIIRFFFFIQSHRT